MGGSNPFNAGVKKIVGYDNEGDKREGEKDASSDAAHNKSDIMKEDNDPAAQGEEDVSSDSKKAVIPHRISKNNDEDEKREGKKDVSGDTALNKSEVEENNDPAAWREEDASGDLKKAVVPLGISKNNNEDREGNEDDSSESTNERFSGSDSRLLNNDEDNNGISEINDEDDDNDDNTTDDDDDDDDDDYNDNDDKDYEEEDNVGKGTHHKNKSCNKKRPRTSILEAKVVNERKSNKKRLLR